ncbi:pancreatic triacylglycerol lipase-like [Copidosoma floridanum]|uniref:pancreatic triacylglycerol lipase-like n=1 Tax=Copidosoma floridanum TaxID=29053 RepID=UPI0006C96C4A|nr:pancreatic triacylglycerol lipase-like [Copidosoma floridanum]
MPETMNSSLSRDGKIYLVSKKTLQLYDTWKDNSVSRRTVFIVHGFASSADEPWVKNLTAAFLKREDVNAIAVDWKNGASFIRGYTISARNTRSTGKEISEFVSRIVDAAWKPNSTVAWGPMYLVGHSIGAHVSAFAANEIQKNNGPWDVTRITGLDPAGPCFDKVGEDMRLDSSDAPFVDVIHTNMATRATVGFGLSDQSGHMDFYVNGGARQPACQDQWMDISCDHSMAYRYFIDSLGYHDGVTCSFFASKSNGNRYWSSIFKGPEDCNEKVEMGINAEKYKNKCSGTFDVATGKASPFCERTKKWYEHWQNPLYQLLGMTSKMF